jgi:hypothetical protein
MVPDVSKDHSAIFRVKIPTVINLLGLLVPEVEGFTFVRNVDNQLLLDTV